MTSPLNSAVRCCTSTATAMLRPASVSTKSPVRKVSRTAPASISRPSRVSPGNRSGRTGARSRRHARPPNTTGRLTRRLAPARAGVPCMKIGTDSAGSLTSTSDAASRSVAASRARFWAMLSIGSTDIANPRRVSWRAATVGAASTPLTV